MISLFHIQLGEAEERLALEVIRSGRLAQGPVVERFEEEFRRLAGTAHAVAVNSGTSALVASLDALDIKAGDEVITTPFTFAATLNAIVESGATVRFADILADDFTIDPARIEASITSRTAGIMPVHLFGYPADMGRIAALSETHGLAIIEDAAQAHTAVVEGRQVGSFGLGCFSFYATKNVTTGEGGIITTDDGAVADRLRLLRGHGMRKRYQYELLGHNYRMSELDAAIGLPQLARLGELTRRRQQNAARLSEGLQGLPGVITPRVAPGRTHVFHLYTIRLTSESPLDRGSIADGLKHLEIETGVYYPRTVFDYPCYRSHPQVRLEPMPMAESAAREVLSIPVHPWLSENDIDQIVEGIRSLIHRN